VALALVAASLVRSTGYALGNASAEAVQGAVALLLTAALAGFFLIFVVAGGRTDIAHFHHFLEFLFGGATEAMYAFSRQADDADERAGQSDIRR
jgi:hypothetical protein